MNSLLESKYTDSSTGLLNEDYLKTIFPIYQDLLQDGEILCLCYIDMNNLKNINSAFEHAGGDLAIKAIADYLKNIENQRSTVARLKNAGDEFAVVALFKKADDIQRFVEKVAFASKSIEIDGETFNLQISIGAVYAEKVNNDTYGTFPQKADKLMNKAKNETTTLIMCLKGKEYEMKSESKYLINSI